MCAGLTALGHVGRGAVHSLPFLPAQLTIARLSPYTCLHWSGALMPSCSDLVFLWFSALAL